MDRPNCIVIGAGFAGLSAARALAEARYTVIILEADAAVGGRARTLQLSPQLALELGCTWFHGLGSQEQPNPVLGAALGAGLLATPPVKSEWWQSTYVLPGRTTDLTKAEQLVVHKVFEAYAEVIEELEEGSEGSVREHLDTAWDGFMVKSTLLSVGHDDAIEYNETLKLAKAAWQWRDGLQSAIDGSPTEEQSAGALSLYTEFESSDAHAAVPTLGGYQSIAEGMAQGLDVRLHHQVNSITWGEHGVVVQCTNGSTFTADSAVVTVSLGVLKAHHKAWFQPPLPEDKAAAIERLQIGIVDKIFIVFGDHQGGFMRTPTEEGAKDENSLAIELDEETVSYSLLWPDTTTAPPELAAAVNTLPSWARSIYSIRFGGPEIKLLRNNHQDSTSSAPSSSRCHVAVVWLTGPAATAMEHCTDEAVIAGVRAAVDLFPSIELPDGASWEDAALSRSSWGSNPLTNGSYSYIPSWSSPADVEALAQPLTVNTLGGQCIPEGEEIEKGKAVVCFAGEACSVRYIGTTHGAYLTGKQQAERLLMQNIIRKI